LLVPVVLLVYKIEQQDTYNKKTETDNSQDKKLHGHGAEPAGYGGARKKLLVHQVGYNQYQGDADKNK
jgi:hypothetical protein